MNILRTNDGILTEMTAIILSHLSSENLELAEDSFFAKELLIIPDLDRRNFIRTYLCDSAFFLLHGIIDQVHSLDAVISRLGHSGAVVSPYVLIRSILEWSFKLVYLTDPNPDASERIKRSLKCLFNDIEEYRKVPTDLSSPASRDLVADQAKFAKEWYRELTGGKEELHRVSALGIFEAVARDSNDPWLNLNWVQDGKGALKPLAYSKGYGIFSSVSHANLWAIQHFGMHKTSEPDGESVVVPILDPSIVCLMQILAGQSLWNSFGLAVKFTRGDLPTATMNQLETLIDAIRNKLRSELNEST